MLGLASAAGAGNDPYSPDTLALFRLSGLEVQIASMESQIVDSISIQTRELPKEVRGALIESVAEQFASGAVRKAALTRLEQGRDPERAKEVLEWLRSPLGRRITALEEATSTAQGMADLQAYARTLADTPPPQVRVAFAERLDAATRSTDNAVDAAVGSNLVIAVVINATRPVPDQLGDQELRRVIEAQRDQLRPMLQQLTLVSFLYMYRELEEAGLERYIAFLESDAGAWFNGLGSRAMVETLLTLAGRMGGVLGEALQGMGTKRAL